jgi:hypothetical protein
MMMMMMIMIGVTNQVKVPSQHSHDILRKLIKLMLLCMMSMFHLKLNVDVGKK